MKKTSYVVFMMYGCRRKINEEEFTGGRKALIKNEKLRQEKS